MTKTETYCPQTCKEICTAIEVALVREKEAILLYGKLRDQCTYPDIKVVLNDLILGKQKSIRLLEESRSLMRAKFHVLDQIRDGFEM